MLAMKQFSLKVELLIPEQVQSLGQSKYILITNQIHVKNTKDIRKFRIIDQSSIAAGIRRVEALRDKQLEDYEKSVKKDKSSKEKNHHD